MEIKRKFNVGDRVRLLAKFGGGYDRCLNFGSVGTVVGYFAPTSDIVYVSWDDFRSGHNCHGLLTGERVKSGWNYYEHDLELTEEAEPISLDISSIL